MSSGRQTLVSSLPNFSALFKLGLTLCTATQGGGGISPTFGAGLWIVDYVMQAVLLGSEVSNPNPQYADIAEIPAFQALFFHQGTIGNCEYISQRCPG